MNFNQYTEKAQEAVLGAQQLAEREGHPQIDPEHLLRALVDQQDGVVPSVLRQLGADPARLLADVDAELGRRPQARGGAEPGPSPRLRAVDSVADAEAKRLKPIDAPATRRYRNRPAHGRSPGGRRRPGAQGVGNLPAGVMTLTETKAFSASKRVYEQVHQKWINMFFRGLWNTEKSR